MGNNLKWNTKQYYPKIHSISLSLGISPISRLPSSNLLSFSISTLVFSSLQVTNISHKDQFEFLSRTQIEFRRSVKQGQLLGASTAQNTERNFEISFSSNLITYFSLNSHPWRHVGGQREVHRYKSNINYLSV